MIHQNLPVQIAIGLPRPKEVVRDHDAQLVTGQQFQCGSTILSDESILGVACVGAKAPHAVLVFLCDSGLLVLRHVGPVGAAITGCDRLAIHHQVGALAKEAESVGANLARDEVRSAWVPIRVKAHLPMHFVLRIAVPYLAAPPDHTLVVVQQLVDGVLLVARERLIGMERMIVPV